MNMKTRAANFQKAGKILQTHYPRIVLTHGAEHVLSLFFQIFLKRMVGDMGL
jgi:hypothetical protein